MSNLDWHPLEKAINRYALFGETTPADEFEAALAGATSVSHIHIVPEEWVL